MEETSRPNIINRNQFIVLFQLDMRLVGRFISYLISNIRKVRPITESAVVLNSLCPLQCSQVGPCSSDRFHIEIRCVSDMKPNPDCKKREKKESKG